MSSQVLITPVDEIVTFIKSHPKSSIQMIAKTFKLKEDLVEKWITVLEEQKVLKIEYSGLDSLITFKEKKAQVKKIDIEQIKELFVQACYKKKISTDKMKELWEVFFTRFELEIKSEFEKECVKKGFDKKKIPLAWKRFRKTLEKL